MATVTKGKTFTTGEVVTTDKLHQMVDSATVAAIVNADIDPAAGIAAGRLANALDLSGKTVTLPAAQPLARPVMTGVREAIVNTGVVSGSQTLNLNSGNIFQVKPNGAITIAFSNPPASGTFVGILFRHEGDGTARTYTWPVTTRWAFGEEPVATSTNGKFDLFSLFTYDGGTTYFGQILGQDYT